MIMTRFLLSFPWAKQQQQQHNNNNNQRNIEIWIDWNWGPFSFIDFIPSLEIIEMGIMERIVGDGREEGGGGRRREGNKQIKIKCLCVRAGNLTPPRGKPAETAWHQLVTTITGALPNFPKNPPAGAAGGRCLGTPISHPPPSHSFPTPWGPPVLNGMKQRCRVSFSGRVEAAAVAAVAAAIG